MTTTYSGVAEDLSRELGRRLISDDEMLKLLTQIGELALTRAKSPTGKNWKDQTGNARSSLGYVIVHNGDIVTLSGFKIVKTGAEGSNTGRDYATALAYRLGKQDCWQIILVMGMSYSVDLYNKGYDVCISAEREVKRLMSNLKRNLNKRK